MEKKCNRCDIVKPIEDFLFKNKKLNKRHGSCSECFKIIRKESYEKNKETTIKRNKKNRRKNRNWLNEYKKNIFCFMCGENHPATLEFHHEDPNEKEHNVSNLVNYSITKIKKEIKKCKVVCSNCHKKIHYELDNNNNPL